MISRSRKNPGGALELIDYLTERGDQITRDAASTRCRRCSSRSYDDPEVQKAMPFAAELKEAIAQAKSRPVSPVYPQISQAIYKNVNEALSG